MEHGHIRNYYEQYKNGIFRYALSITKDPHLAEDILQETFLKLLSGASPRDPAKIQSWLYRVAHNLCVDHLRRAKREQPAPEASPDGTNPYAYIEMLSGLSPKDQEIVTLKIVGSLTHREIGAVLGIAAKAAQKRYQRAIAALREQEESWNRN